MGSPFFPCGEAPSGSTELERLDMLDEVLPLRVPKTPARPISTQFIPCGTSVLRHLNDRRCCLPWLASCGGSSINRDATVGPRFIGGTAVGGGLLASSLLKCSPEVTYPQTYARFDSAEGYLTALGDLSVCPSPKICEFNY